MPIEKKCEEFINEFPEILEDETGQLSRNLGLSFSLFSTDFQI